MSIVCTSPFLLQTHQLSGGLGNPGVIEQLDAAWSAGVHWIVGDEGRGKTTLLRLLAGDLAPTGGQVIGPAGGVFWADLQSPEHDDATLQERWDGLRPRFAAWDEALQQDLTDALALRAHLHKRLNMLSTGSRRKVMLVAALASGADVTLLDQPFVSLDAMSVQVIKDFLSDANEHTHRAWLVADYEAPGDVPMASVLHL